MADFGRLPTPIHARLVRSRNLVATWLMRAHSGGRILQIPLLAVTAGSTLSLGLEGTPLDPYRLHILAIAALGAVVFVWAYDRFEVLKEQDKSRTWRGDNYLGPAQMIGQLVQAKQLGVLGTAIAEDWDAERTASEIERVTIETLDEYANGIDWDETRTETDR